MDVGTSGPVSGFAVDSHKILCRDPGLVTYILFGLLMMQHYSHMCLTRCSSSPLIVSPIPVPPSVYVPPTHLSVFVIVLHQAAV